MRHDVISIKARTAEIVEHGKAERGNFEPEGAPLRLYNYWLGHSNSKRAREVKYGGTRENFCHFWRVVAFWAPFMAFRRGAGHVIESKWFQYPLFALGVLVMLATVVITGSVLIVGGAVAIVGYALFGAIAGAAAGMEGWKHHKDKTKVDKVHVAIASVTAPVSMPAFGIAKLAKNWDTDWNKPIGYAAAGLAGLVALFFLGWAVVATWAEIGWLLPAGIVGSTLTATAIGYGFNALADFIKGRRALKRKRQREAEDAASLARYEAIQNGTYVPPTPKTNNPPEWVMAFAETIANFFSGVGDFIILTTQIVRVNKWKICPTVTIPTEKAKRETVMHDYW